jgi:hypothetical protein
MGHARQSVQRIADVLAEEGLIVYRDNPDERRADLLELTGRVAKVLDSIYALDKAWSRNIMKKLDPDRWRGQGAMGQDESLPDGEALHRIRRMGARRKRPQVQAFFFLGRIFGKMALKSTLKDEGPMRRNVPTLAEFKVREKQGEIELEKAKWIGLLPKYGHFSNPAFIHDFFGRMTEEQIGFLAYKHADHHLRQFGC